MTRKDFELIARALQSARARFDNPTTREQCDPFDALDTAAEEIAAAISKEHPRFNESTFISVATSR